MGGANLNFLAPPIFDRGRVRKDGLPSETGAFPKSGRKPVALVCG